MWKLSLTQSISIFSLTQVDLNSFYLNNQNKNAYMEHFLIVTEREKGMWQKIIEST